MKFYPFFSLSITIALAGCGQMGPLYLPIEPATPVPAVKVIPQTTESTKPVTPPPAVSNPPKSKEK